MVTSAAGILILIVAIFALRNARAWLDVLSGQPHIDSVREATGIVRRQELLRRFGWPGRDQRFTVEPGEVWAARDEETRIVDDPVIALGVLALLVCAAIDGGFQGWLILCAGALYHSARIALMAQRHADHPEALED